MPGCFSLSSHWLRYYRWLVANTIPSYAEPTACRTPRGRNRGMYYMHKQFDASRPQPVPSTGRYQQWPGQPLPWRAKGVTGKLLDSDRMPSSPMLLCPRTSQALKRTGRHLRMVSDSSGLDLCY
jgi:hypothetical protein